MSLLGTRWGKKGRARVRLSPGCVLGRVEEQGEVIPGKHAHKPSCHQAGGSLPVHAACREGGHLLELVPTPASGEHRSLRGSPPASLQGPATHESEFSGRCPPAGCRPWGALVPTGLRCAGGGNGHISRAGAPAGAGKKSVLPKAGLQKRPRTLHQCPPPAQGRRHRLCCSLQRGGKGSLCPACCCLLGGQRRAPPGPIQTPPAQLVPSAGSPLWCFLQMPKSVTRAVMRISPSSGRRAGEMRQKCVRSDVGIVLGSTAAVPLNAEGKVLACFPRLRSTGNRRRGTKTCRGFLKGGLDECMIIFLCQSFFYGGYLQIIGQMRDEG